MSKKATSNSYCGCTIEISHCSAPKNREFPILWRVSGAYGTYTASGFSRNENAAGKAARAQIRADMQEIRAKAQYYEQNQARDAVAEALAARDWARTPEGRAARLAEQVALAEKRAAELAERREREAAQHLRRRAILSGRVWPAAFQGA